MAARRRDAKRRPLFCYAPPTRAPTLQLREAGRIPEMAGWFQVLSLALKALESNHIGFLARLRHYGGFQWHVASPSWKFWAYTTDRRACLTVR